MRGRPRKDRRMLFFDEFADMNLADQDKALEVLAEIHRQAKRVASKRMKPTPTQQKLLDAFGSDSDGGK